MIVVTGAEGFVGRHLMRRLVAEGRQVVGFDRAGAAIGGEVRRVIGDIRSAADRAEALRGSCTAIVHLATLPGAAAERDAPASRRINLDATYDLALDAAAAGSRPRFVFASSIAVLGDRLPSAGVDDSRPAMPRLIYGGHKAMAEQALAMFHNRGQIDSVCLRLPAILARPPGPSGMKSAFISEVFHALRSRKSFVSPVSAAATVWAQSVDCCVDNLVHALDFDSDAMPASRVVTLPALHFAFAELFAEIASQQDAPSDLVGYAPDDAIEAAFGAQPPLLTPAAEQAGFRHDGALSKLVSRALAAIERLNPEFIL